MKTYHIILRTRQDRTSMLTGSFEVLEKMISHVCSRKKRLLHLCGMQPDHVHILIDLQNDVFVSRLVQKLKPILSNQFAELPMFGAFAGWQPGYYWCSVPPEKFEETKVMIESQDILHRQITTDEELDMLKNSFQFQHKKGKNSAHRYKSSEPQDKADLP